MTPRQTIIAAAKSLEERGRVPWTTAQLAVTAWTLDEQAFGLAGFGQSHPDHHKVIGMLSGSARGMVADGTFVRVAQGQYRLKAGVRAEAQARVALRCDLDLLLRHALPFVGSEPDSQIAKAFYTHTLRDTWADSIARMDAALDECEVAIRTAPRVLSDGRAVELADVKLLIAFHEYLMMRFATRLKHLDGLAADRERKAKEVKT